jgi:hypothetical protein
MAGECARNVERNPSVAADIGFRCNFHLDSISTRHKPGFLLMQMDDYPQQAPSYSWQESTSLWRTSHEEIARRNMSCWQGQARHRAVAASGPDTSNNVWNRAMSQES